MGASGNRVAAALGAATVVLVSCGGGGGDGDTGSADGSTVGEPAATESFDLMAPTGNDRGSVDDGTAIAAADLAELPPEIVAVVDLAFESHGDPGGAAAIVYAIERGYNAGQLAGTGDLTADGVLQTDGVAVVAAHSRALAVFLPDDENAGNEESLGARPLGFRRSPVGQLGQVNVAALFDAALRDGGTSAALAAAVVSLDESGYDLEQIIAETIFGEAPVWTEDGGCVRIGYAPVRPARLDTRCALGIHALADEIDAIDESTTTTTAPLGGTDDLGFEPGTFVGSFATQPDADLSGGEVVIDVITFEVGDTLTGRAELLADPNFGETLLDGSEPECLYVLLTATDVPLADPAAGRFEGEITVGGAFIEGSCPSSAPTVEVSEVGTVTATVDGDTLSVVGADGVPIIAMRVES